MRRRVLEDRNGNYVFIEDGGSVEIESIGATEVTEVHDEKEWKSLLTVKDKRAKVKDIIRKQSE